MENRLESLSRRIEDWLEDSRRSAGALRAILEQTREETSGASSSGEPAGASARDLAALAEFAARASGLSDQTALMNGLMDAASSRASRLVLFISRADGFTGWMARGLPAGFNARKLQLPRGQDDLVTASAASCSRLEESASSRDGNEALAGGLGGESPERMAAFPFWVKDRVVAVLYADASEGDDSWSPEALSLICSLGSLCLESLPLRARYPKPAASAPARSGAAVPHSPAALAHTLRAAGPPPAPPEPVSVDDAAGEEEAALREEAQRFARLLVSEIVLYNGAHIEEGRRQKDLYQRLKEDIERSRRMYEQRVSPRVTGALGFFRQELVRQLAAGDASALSTPWG